VQYVQLISYEKTACISKSLCRNRTILALTNRHQMERHTFSTGGADLRHSRFCPAGSAGGRTVCACS